MSTTARVPAKAAKLSCTACPLRRMDSFRDFTPEQLDFVGGFKTGELFVDPGATVLVEGSHSAHLFTVLEGWGFRHKLIDDGRRQILNYILPGSLIGLQGTLLGEMQHTVEALTPLRLCVFERSRLFTLYERHAALAYDITWIAAREERMLDENILSLGRRSSLESAAYLLAVLARRAKLVGATGSTATLPLTQQHVADTLGLSLVHTNKTLRRLAQRGLIRWRERECDVLDPDALAAIARWHPDDGEARPLI